MGEDYDLLFLLLGVSFVGIGVAARFRPHWLVGFNTLSFAQRNRVDWKGLARFSLRWFSLAGVLIPALYRGLSRIGSEQHVAVCVTFLLYVLSLLAFAIFAARYNQN